MPKRLLALFLCAGTAHAAGTDWTPEAVKAPDFTAMRSGAAAPDEPALRRVLANANRYLLGTWWKSRGFDRPADDGFLDLKGRTEHRVRPAADEALSLAISLKLGAYDPAVTGVTVKDAEARLLLMIRTLAHRHSANTPKGWGRQWQSPHWSARTAAAAWIFWDKLDETARREVLAMLHVESDWVASNKGADHIKVYRNAVGKIVSPGDTGSEENAWDADVPCIAACMMPDAPSRPRWMNLAVRLLLQSTSRPSDTTRTDTIHGKPLRDWLAGSNINEDGTLVNHGMIHPDYMTAPAELNMAPYFVLATKEVPRACLFNADLLFDALTTVRFTPGARDGKNKVRPPGGTVYRPGSDDIYYPFGNDWGTSRRMDFVTIDTFTAVYSPDTKRRTKAAGWIPLHLADPVRMQARFDDGRTYGNASEDTYPSREAWVAIHTATALLNLRVGAAGFRVSDASY